MTSTFAVRLAVWRKRREIARISEHLLWLKENQEFVRLQIPRYEAERRRLQAKLFLMEPVHRPLLLQPRPQHLPSWPRLPRFSATLVFEAAWAWVRLAVRAIAVAWSEATPTGFPLPMRRSGLPGRRMDSTWR
jgi:hypothetical protein